MALGAQRGRILGATARKYAPFRRGATTKTARLRLNSSGRWGLPSISMPLVGHLETATFPPHFEIAPGKAHRLHGQYLRFRQLGRDACEEANGPKFLLIQG